MNIIVMVRLLLCRFTKPLHYPLPSMSDSTFAILTLDFCSTFLRAVHLQKRWSYWKAEKNVFKKEVSPNGRFV